MGALANDGEEVKTQAHSSASAESSSAVAANAISFLADLPAASAFLHLLVYVTCVWPMVILRLSAAARAGGLGQGAECAREADESVLQGTA